MRGGKYVPTEKDRRFVQVMSAGELTHDQICHVLGIGSKHTLYKYFQDELDHGGAHVKAKVAAGLVRTATSWMDAPGQKPTREELTAMIFFAKTKMGWREVTRVENTGEDGGPLKIIIGGSDAKL